MISIQISLLAILVVLALAQNPFQGKTFYVNPSYQKELDTSIATATGKVKDTLQSMRDVPSAYWIDVMSKITGTGTDTVEGILADAASKSPVPLVVFIVYDLPNRDCHAKASNGEICCTANADGTCDYNAGGDCSAGINTYKTKYIDPLVAVFKKYSQVPIVAVIEPDSLPNLATNQADPHCGNSATSNAYKVGIPYAINQISTCSNVVMYLDAAHGGWLGWQNNMQSFAQTVSGLGILNKIRGFSTNVANYQPIGAAACPVVGWCLNGQHQSDPCCADPCRLEGQYNPANNELNYVAEMVNIFNSGGVTPHFIIDTGRNGVPNMRQDCANWCNIRGAGIGMKPTTNTANSTYIDAYYWLKTPGESDGCTQMLPDGTACPRFDSFCGSQDSIGSRAGEPRAPQAGKWFDFQIKMLAENAHMTWDKPVN
jgi:cellulose 1,4-beta-cellobiosidase